VLPAASKSASIRRGIGVKREARGALELADDRPAAAAAAQPTDGIDDSKTGADRLVGVFLMHLRVPEISQDALAHVLGDKAAELASTSATQR